jgi:uncharacterized Tic20 family protein
MKKTFLACALGLTLLGTSCLGPNKTWNSLHDWNTKVSDSKWGNEAIFFGLTIIPVYSLVYLFDILITNSIDFWGDAPAAGK